MAIASTVFFKSIMGRMHMIYFSSIKQSPDQLTRYESFLDNGPNGLIAYAIQLGVNLCV